MLNYERKIKTHEAQRQTQTKHIFVRGIHLCECAHRGTQTQETLERDLWELGVLGLQCIMNWSETASEETVTGVTEKAFLQVDAEIITAKFDFCTGLTSN